MIFTYNKWDCFCKSLMAKGIISVSANSIEKGRSGFLILKHDVETNVRKAFKMSKIEYKYGHHGSYYIQAYLLKKTKNIQLLKRMQCFGHEISYHYDVLDSSKGDIEKAKEEFEKNKKTFEKYGFTLVTVCQHGNPLIERNGYTSNRDFFRNIDVQRKYPAIADIMVNFKSLYCVDYLYYSDAGRQFNLIYDPLNNDIVNSDDKNVPFSNLNELQNEIRSDGNYIISTHPHRWESTIFVYGIKVLFFKVVKTIAKALYRIPAMKKVMSKYYYLAKKI